MIFLVALFVGVSLLVVSIIWMNITKKRVINRGDTNAITVFTVFAIAILVMCSFALLVVPQRTYNWDYSYNLEIRITDSSPDINVGDLWVRTNRTHSDASVYPHIALDYISVYGLDNTAIEEVMITYNETPIFWGNHNLLLNVFSNFERTLIFYQNGSQAILYDPGLGFWDHPTVTYHFAGGGSWADIELLILGPPVDP